MSAPPFAVERRRVVIVGAGFGGIGAAIRLRQAGIDDFVVLERSGDVGGTWQANSYPGCQCDIPSHLYSFSFAPNPDWSRTYSPQPEIWEYLRRVARDHDVMQHIRFAQEVSDCSWQENRGSWRVESASGEVVEADIAIVAAGFLSEPRVPEIAGIESFGGAIFHSAAWNHEHSLAGERVAVVGTGASALQIIPCVQREAARLHVFQRTPAWVMPHSQRETTELERELFRAFPPAQRALRGLIYAMNEARLVQFMHPFRGSPAELVAMYHLRRQVRDPVLRRKLTPHYRIGCKRVLISNDYYPALQQPNVELVTDAIDVVTPRGIRTVDGVERELDAIVLATGFHVTDAPLARWIHCRGGESLAERWAGSPQAYIGTTIAGAPNLFMLAGPNTGLGHNSIVFMLESQLSYVIDCIRQLDERGGGVFEVREDVQRRFNDDIQRRLAGSVWMTGGCASWYIDANGRNTTIWPGSTWRFRQALRRFDAADYELRPAVAADAHSNGRPAVSAAAPRATD